MNDLQRNKQINRRSPFFWVSLLFLVGIFFNTHFFWCHWFGFSALWFLYQKNQKDFFKKFLLPCWLVFLAVYGIFFYWLLLYDDLVYLICTLISSLVFPFFFLLCHLAAGKTKLVILHTVVIFGIFLLLKFALEHIFSVGTAPFDVFFYPPVGIPRILPFLNFKVWCSFIMAVCFLTGWLFYKRLRIALIILPLFWAGIAVLISFMINHPLDSRQKTPVKIALIQHNLPFTQEWRDAHPSEIKKKYEALALKAAEQHPDLIIFPQYTFSEDVYRKPDFFTALAQKTGVPILIGTQIPMKANPAIYDFDIMDLALLFTPEGKLGSVYQAREGAPFGNIPQHFSKKYQVIETSFGKLGVLLCYEDMTPRIAKEAVKSGAEILVVLSNPGLFPDTPAPYYQLQQDQLRVLESGLPLLRVSPNGYSAFVDSTGRIIQKTRLKTEDILYIDYQPMNKIG